MIVKKIKNYLVLCAAVSSLLVQFPVHAEITDDSHAEIAETILADISTNEIPNWPQGPDIAGGAGIVLEHSTGNVLYGKNMDVPLYPGSTVKIMTMLLAIENSDLQDEVTMTSTGVAGVTDGGVTISAQLGETFTMEQCLYAVMLSSANDVATQIAEYIGGSVDSFIEMMNARARELGCTNTVFTNPTGLPNTEQHTTAHDMALIMKTAMSNDVFRRIAGASSYTIPATNVSGGERALSNSFEMQDSTKATYYSSCIGGKNGFTDASGETLVCTAVKNDLTLTCVILMGASETTAADAASLLEYGFNNFCLKDLGRDDFEVLEGGIVLAPVDAGIENFDIVDTETEDGNIHRVYKFSGYEMGTAECLKPKLEDNTAIANSEQNLTAARAFSEQHTLFPYILIGAVGGLVILLLFILMVKVIRS